MATFVNFKQIACLLSKFNNFDGKFIFCCQLILCSSQLIWSIGPNFYCSVITHILLITSKLLLLSILQFPEIKIKLFSSVVLLKKKTRIFSGFFICFVKKNCRKTHLFRGCSCKFVENIFIVLIYIKRIKLI